MEWIGQVVFVFVSVSGFYQLTPTVSGCIRNTTCLPRIVNNMILDFQWATVTFIHGTLEEDHISYSLKHQRYNVDEIDLHTALDIIHSSSFPDINIVIAVNDTWSQEIMKQIDTHDMMSNGSTDFRHHSKIMLLMRNISRLAELELVIHNVENVVVLIARENIDDPPDEHVTFYTLHIHPTRRVFTSVSEERNGSLIDTFFPNVKYGYNNRRLVATTLESPPYVVKTVLNGSVDYNGYIFDIWKIIAKRLNFSFDITEPQDGNWGDFEKGQWNGMVRQLINKEVDVATADMTVYHERSLHIDYVFPTLMVDRTDIIYRRQLSSGKTHFLLLGPLRTDVYAIFLAVCAGIICIFSFMGDRIQLNSLLSFDVKFRQLRHQLSINSWGFLGTIFRQEFKILPTTYAGKLLLSSWWLLVLLVTSVYCANLIAALTSQTGLSRLSSIDELVDSDYTTGTYTVGMQYETIKTSDRSELRRLHAKMLKSSEHDYGIFANDLDYHIDRVKKGGHSYVIYKSTAEQYLAEDCLLALIGEPVTWSEELITFALPKGSPLKFDIDRTMYDLRESGILDVLWKKWTSGKKVTSCVVERQITAITMREVTGGFLVVGGGVGLSLLILVVEICYKCAYKAI